MRRSFFLIGIGLLALILIGVAIYFIFFTKTPELTVTPGDPFGGLDGNDTDGNGGDTAIIPAGAGAEVAPRLFRITDQPVAYGSIALSIGGTAEPSTVEATATATTTPVITPRDTEIRYVDRASGNVYSYLLKERSLARLSNRTLPGVYRATWLSDGSTAYVQFLSTGDEGGGERIETYALPAEGEGGFFLEQGLSQIMTQGTSTVVSLLSNTNGSIATAARPDGSGASTAFSSTLSAITLGFLDEALLATSKPSIRLDGYAFTVDQATGTFTRFLGPLRGLSTLASPLGKNVLFGHVEQGSIVMQIMNIDTREVVPIPLDTLPEKCVWSADESFLYCAAPRSLSGVIPDDWHQGAHYAPDRVWEVDLRARVATLLVDPFEIADVTIDATNLAIDPARDVLVFTNRIDGSLWAYDL